MDKSLVGGSLVGGSLGGGSLVGGSLVGGSLVGGSLEGGSLEGGSLGIALVEEASELAIMATPIPATAREAQSTRPSLSHAPAWRKLFSKVRSHRLLAHPPSLAPQALEHLFA